MKFTTAQVRQVQRGEKTVQRILAARHRKPSVGDSLVIRTRQPADPVRNQPEVEEVRIQVTNVDRETLQNLTTASVAADGYTGPHPLADFMHDWMLTHDPGYPPLTEALCLVCQGQKHYEDHDGETVECEECDEVGTIQVPTRPDTETIIERFEHRHAHHLVHVIRFTYQADITKWVNRRAHLPPTTAMGEALDPTAPLLGPPSKQWREKAEQRRKDAARDRDGARLAGLDRLLAAYQAELLRLAIETDTSDQVRGAAHTIRQQHERARQRLTTDDDQDRKAA